MHILVAVVMGAEAAAELPTSSRFIRFLRCIIVLKIMLLL